MKKPEEPDHNENNAKVITSEPKSTQDPKLAKKLSKDEKKAEKQKAKEEVTKKRQEQANLDYAVGCPVFLQPIWQHIPPLISTFKGIVSTFPGRFVPF